MHITVMSLLDQTVKPGRIILWLSKVQFPGGMADLPRRLVKLQDESALTIRFVDYDIKSFKKFVYMLEEFQSDDFVTVDDDVLYAPKTIEHLLSLHDSYPQDIICMSAVEITDIKALR